MTRVPKGEDFLPKYSKEKLHELYRKEENSKAQIRLLAAILRKEGMTLEEISKKVKYPLTTVGDWLRRMHLNGISRRYSIKQPGRPKRLTHEQEIELDLFLSQSPQKAGLPFVLWTTKLVRAFIEQHYGVVYKIRQVRNLLICLGFSCQKPRPAHRKANKKFQEAFKKTSGKEFKPMLTMDMRSYFWMKASFQ
jgi:transposase